MNGRSAEDFATLLDEVETRTRLPYGVNLILKDNPRLNADLATCLAHRVALIITSLGDPARVVEAAHARGVKVFCDVTTMRHARKAVASGADGLIAVCAGAGGHAGQISPFVLVPWLASEFDIPVAAAGGIADGRGLAAALTLGAEAAYVGTRFIASSEAIVVDDYRDAVLRGDVDDVEYTPEVTGVPCNFLKVSVEAMRRGEIGPEQRFKNIWSAGQTVALCSSVQTASAIVRGMVSDAQQILTRLANP